MVKLGLALALCVFLPLCAAQTPPAPDATTGKAAPNVTVTETKIDSPVADIQWVGKEKKTVFVRSTKNFVYRSKDEGKNWEKQNWKMEKAGSEEEGKSGILSVHSSAVDSKKIFFRGAGKQHWVTFDEGDHYMPLEPSFTIKELKMHPTEADWMMASHLSDGCHKAGERVNCSMEVYLSVDFGKVWKPVTSYVAQFDWGPSLDGVLKAGMQKESMFLVTYEKKEGNQPFGVWSSKANFVRSDDLWKTNYMLLPRGNRFLFLDRFLFVAVVNKHHENQVNLYVADVADGGKTFKKARLPFQLTEHSYTILDTSEGSVFLHVNHGDYHTGYGNIYLSDAEGLRFALSLRHNKRDAQGRCDFEKLQGIEGIYITNEQINAEADLEGGRHEKPRLRTKITFDKGGKWQTLKPPLTTDKGRDFPCRQDDDPACSLHLHGVTDSWGPFYSSKNAIGLVMATGNVGHHLSSKEDEVHTFFSRDAGLSWSMVRQGSHIYEYGDHGAIIVIADDRKASTEVYFSWDEAMTWNELHYTDTGTEIENIVIEPQATSQVFVMYGSRGDLGMIYQLDFRSMHEQPCKGVENAGDPSSDYELWTPSDGRQGGKCLLGHQVRYTRRRRASTCFNGQEYERVEFRKNCACAEEDYECDFGYERSSDNGPCVAIMAISNAAPKECSGYYTVSNGYRLIAGDSCDSSQGVDHLHTKFRCPGIFGSSAEVSGGGWLVLLVLGGLGGLLAFVTLTGRSERFRELMPSSLGSLLPGKLGSFGGFGGFGNKNQYRGLNSAPDSATDDELDLGDDDEEAEELHDGDLSYDRGGRLGTLPMRQVDSQVPKLASPEEGSLLGDEFTSKKGE
jgi:hypothetical protein